MPTISIEQFLALDIDLPGFRVFGRDGRGQAGIKLEEIDEHTLGLLTPEEAMAIRAHPTGDLTEPILRFPCTVHELLEFMRWAGIECEGDREHIAQLLSKDGHLAPWDDETLGKRERQSLLIESVIDMKMWDRFAVPVGEKATIKDLCILQRPDLFDGEDSFRNAWKAGVPERWRMANHADASRRHNRTKSED